MKIEYKVRPVTRFVVTRYCENGHDKDSISKGEFDNFQTAYSVAYALAEHDRSLNGFDLGDEHVIFPESVIYQSEKKFDAMGEWSAPQGEILKL